MREINKYEVFPILQTNLLSPAGAWAGFDEDWLIDKITTKNSRLKLLAGRKTKKATRVKCQMPGGRIVIDLRDAYQIGAF